MEQRPQRACACGEVRRVTRRERVDLAGTLELASRELAHRLEHAEARLGRGVVHLHERLIHEVLEQVEHLRRRESLVGYDGLGGIEGERTREDGETPQEQLLGLGEQRVTPRDRSFDRLVARQHHRVAAGEHPDRVAEPVEDLRRREDATARRRKLDGQRYPVEPSADLGHVGRVVVVQAEVLPALDGTVGEEADRVVLREHRDRFVCRVSRRESRAAVPASSARPAR